MFYTDQMPGDGAITIDNFHNEKIHHQLSVLMIYWWQNCKNVFEIISYLTIYRDEFIIFGMWKTNTLNTLRPSNALLIGELNIIGSDKDFSPGRRQAIMRTDARILDTQEETSEKC